MHPFERFIKLYIPWVVRKFTITCTLGTTQIHKTILSRTETQLAVFGAACEIQVQRGSKFGSRKRGEQQNTSAYACSSLIGRSRPAPARDFTRIRLLAACQIADSHTASPESRGPTIALLKNCVSKMNYSSWLFFTSFEKKSKLSHRYSY